MSIHRAKKKRCTLCRPAKGFRTKRAIRQHGRQGKHIQVKLCKYCHEPPGNHMDCIVQEFDM